MAETAYCYPAGWDNTSGNYSYKTNSLYNYLEDGGYLVEGETNSAENIPNLTTSDKRFLSWQVNTSSRTSSYVYVLFDFSAIPEDAQIESVTCTIYAQKYSFSNDSSWSAEAQVYCGEETRGEAQGVTLYTGTTHNSECFVYFTEIGDWTREELNSFRIKLSAMTSSSLSSISANFISYSGGTVYVTYSVGGIKGCAMVGGEWKTIKEGYAMNGGEWKKINGAGFKIGGEWKKGG